jgi:hypothetical protein
MASELQQLEATIRGLESQRALLGEAIVDAALGPLRDRLAALRAAGADAHSAPALRHLSILFMDAVGSTALAEQLDAEEVAAVMNGPWHARPPSSRRIAARCWSTQATASSRSSVPTALRRTIAERAVRCGLALLVLGRTLAAKCRPPTATPASTFGSASTAAACCSGAASTTTSRSAAAP